MISLDMFLSTEMDMPEQMRPQFRKFHFWKLKSNNEIYRI